MRNPFLQSITRVLLYAGWWILPVSIHSFVLLNTYQLATHIVVVDSLISFSILAILGLSIWYMVRYSELEISQWQKLLQNHLIAMGIIFLIWIGLSMGILNLIYDDTEFVFSQTLLWRFLLFLPVYLLIIATYYLFSFFEKSKDQQLQESKMKAQIREAEFEALKAQINPHFLFNSLNSASSLTLTDPDLARETIINISDFFRFTLLSAKNTFTTLGKEVEHALLYLEIEKGRFGDKIQIDSQLPQEFESLQVPALILQPLVENAVKHGVYESTHTIRIGFDYEIIGDKLKITLTNDVDPKSGSSVKGTGTGLNNVAFRLLIAYEIPDLLQTRKSENEFTVMIWIPIKNNAKNIEEK